MVYISIISFNFTISNSCWTSVCSSSGTNSTPALWLVGTPKVLTSCSCFSVSSYADSLPNVQYLKNIKKVTSFYFCPFFILEKFKKYDGADVTADIFF